MNQPSHFTNDDREEFVELRMTVRHMDDRIKTIESGISRILWIGVSTFIAAAISALGIVLKIHTP